MKEPKLWQIALALVLSPLGALMVGLDFILFDFFGVDSRWTIKPLAARPSDRNEGKGK